MAKFKSNLHLEKKDLKSEDKIRQGDLIFCKASGGAFDFWGIYTNHKIVSLDGGGMGYIPEGDVYLHKTYRHWRIEYRISCEDAEIIINKK